MDWLEVVVDTAPDGLDAVCAKLTALGFGSFEIEDERDFQSFLEHNRQYWDYVDEALSREKRGKCRVKLYIPDGAPAADTIAALRAGMEELRSDCPGLELGSLRITAGQRREEEWAEAWKRYYKPFPVGEKLFIRPEWIKAPCPPGRTELVSNPGMAFGTGTHASTRLCLMLLEKAVSGGETLLDLGCGSGILSIAALLLGAKRAAGVDIDPNAADVAARNAELNRVGGRFTALSGDVLTDSALLEKIGGQKYDLITANIVADVVAALGPTAKRLLKPGGRFIVSGIIDTRAAEVENALRARGFSVESSAEAEGWRAMTLTL